MAAKYNGMTEEEWRALAYSAPATFFEQANVSLCGVKEPWVSEAYCCAARRDPYRAMDMIEGYAAQPFVLRVVDAALQQAPEAAEVYQNKWSGLKIAPGIMSLRANALRLQASPEPPPAKGWLTCQQARRAQREASRQLG